MSNEHQSGDEFRLYRDRPEWADVTALPVDEGDPSPVLRIAYAESFADCFGYLRAVIKSGEISERVFELTTTCVNENPSSYTVWLLRRRIIKELKKDIRKELEFMTDQIAENQKNYQVWYHRQKLVEWLGDPTGELEFICEMLEEDAKNYHAWQYRQWLLKTYGLWEGELDLCTEMLRKDCRNNSVWNQRYFVNKTLTNFNEPVVQQELDFTMDMIEKVSRNESAWNYLNGILDHANDTQRAQVLSLCEKLRSSGEQSVFLFSTLLGMYERAKNIEAAKEVAAILKKEDGPRTVYWAFREKMLQAGTA